MIWHLCGLPNFGFLECHWLLRYSWERLAIQYESISTCDATCGVGCNYRCCDDGYCFAMVGQGLHATCTSLDRRSISCTG
jgi:hypothetical protein